jgi:hypothetical protein
VEDRFCGSRRVVQLEAAVSPLLVDVADVDPEDVLELAAAEDK